MNTKDRDILFPALEKLTEITDIEATVIQLPKQGYRKIEAAIELTNSVEKFIFEAEIKNELRTATLTTILAKKEELGRKAILIARYIPTPLKAEFKKNKISYLETSGNCYIETRGLFIYINNQKSAPIQKYEETKLWAPAGMKFVFAILLDPNLLNSSYRNIAQAAGVALGNIGSFISELKRENFITLGIRNSEQILLLENIGILRDKWADMYRATLRPKLMQGKFRFTKKEDRENWYSLLTDDLKVLWGAETAGAILTNYLDPQVFTIYSIEDRIKIMAKFRLLPDLHGEVELLRPFWNQDLFETNDKVVPSLLAYAELISSFDSRNRETANKIKAEYIENKNN